MTAPAPSLDLTSLDSARREIARATAELEHARLEALPLSELRSRHAALRAALDSAVAAAGAAGPGHGAELERLRTQRELHTLAGLSTPGIHVPTCPRTSCRSALGPLIAGMSADPAPALGPMDTRAYGLDLTACVGRCSAADVLDPSSLPTQPSLPEQRPSPRETVGTAASPAL